MTDREKVIKGLECCSSGNMCKEKCPYDELGCEWTDCVRPLAKDALSLLKAQEPRLLKEDDFVEADDWGSIPAWYEHNPSLGIKTIDGWGIIKREKLQDKMTRYWTSRPTEEQREAVKWDE